MSQTTFDWKCHLNKARDLKLSIAVGSLSPFEVTTLYRRDTEGLLKSLSAVTPAPGLRRDRVAGVQESLKNLDSGFRRNDEDDHALAFSATC